MKNEQKLVPKLRFPGFEGNWEEKKLGEILEEGKLGGNYENSQSNEGIAVIKMGNINRGKINIDKVQYLPLNEIYHVADLLKSGDLLFNTRNTLDLVGKVAIWRNEIATAVYNSNLMRLKFSDKLEDSNRFMNYQLNTKKCIVQLRNFATGTTSVAAIYNSDLKRVKVGVPILKEQENISCFLDEVDNKIEYLKKKKALLEKYKKGMMQKIFNQELRFKDENGKDFADWEERRLKTISKIFDGTHMTPNYVEQGIPFYSVESVTGNNYSKTKYISKSIFEKENARVKLEKGDILMTRIGDIGTAKHIDWDVEASFYVSLALIKNNIQFDSEFLTQFIHSSFFQNQLWERTIHVAFPKKINLGEIGECIVYLPSIKEQTKIANFLSAIDQKISHVVFQIEKMEVWKKGLLGEMFV